MVMQNKVLGTFHFVGQQNITLFSFFAFLLSKPAVLPERWKTFEAYICTYVKPFVHYAKHHSLQQITLSSVHGSNWIMGTVENREE
jgi:hypothetical protein